MFVGSLATRFRFFRTVFAVQGCKVMISVLGFNYLLLLFLISVAVASVGFGFWMFTSRRLRLTDIRAFPCKP